MTKKPSPAIYCSDVRALAKPDSLTLHNVSRALYDLFEGADEKQVADTPPIWSKVIVRGQIEICLFTYASPSTTT